MTLQMCEDAAMAAIALQAASRPPESKQVMTLRQTALGPIDPDVVSTAIPAFFIGRNRSGLWVAREARRRVGGLFFFRSSAIDFAHRRSRPDRCALVFPTETFELDVENRGNPLIVLAGRAIRLIARVTTRHRA